MAGMFAQFFLLAFMFFDVALSAVRNPDFDPLEEKVRICKVYDTQLFFSTLFHLLAEHRICEAMVQHEFWWPG